ncbi:hypothetical protein Tco_0506505 [Tanacetum coccineum]
MHYGITSSEFSSSSYMRYKMIPIVLNHGLPEFVDDTVTDYTRPTPSVDVSKDVRSDLDGNNTSIFEQGETSGYGWLGEKHGQGGNIDDKGYWDSGFYGVSKVESHHVVSQTVLGWVIGTSRIKRGVEEDGAGGGRVGQVNKDGTCKGKVSHARSVALQPYSIPLPLLGCVYHIRVNGDESPAKEASEHTSSVPDWRREKRPTFGTWNGTTKLKRLGQDLRPMGGERSREASKPNLGPHHTPPLKLHSTNIKNLFLIRQTTLTSSQEPTSQQISTPSHTPTPRRLTKRAIRIAQSKALTPGADEPVSPPKMTSGEAFPTATSLDAAGNRKTLQRPRAKPQESSPSERFKRPDTLLEKERAKRLKTVEGSRQQSEGNKDVKEKTTIMILKISKDKLRGGFIRFIRVFRLPKAYPYFEAMLKEFDRDDMVTLWKLVKDRYDLSTADDVEIHIPKDYASRRA